MIFAEGFNELNHGAAADVLPFEDQVYFTIYPDVWGLKDTNADGVADQQEILHRGFGVHAAYDGHDIHGLTVGPDGYIYFSVGDNGISVHTKEDGAFTIPTPVVSCVCCPTVLTCRFLQRVCATCRSLLLMPMETCFRSITTGM